jgi:predicted metal-dependent phosphoesterase TrpH
MIDLHLHTNASDGLCSPEVLVQHAAAAGVTVLAVTDHDTVAGTLSVAEKCATKNIRAISGIEITAVECGRDVHILGYFVDPAEKALSQFLSSQRADRVSRVRAIAQRLASLGVPVDLDRLFENARIQEGRSIGRPQVAHAMVVAGHVVDTREAFDRWLGAGKPGFVPRIGAPPERVIEIIHGARGLASLAHPGATKVDDRMLALRDAGLDALEIYHPDHPPEVTERYRIIASKLGMLVTGGSDYHGDSAHGLAPGSVTLPQRDWERLDAWQQPS